MISLIKASENVVQDCLGVKKGEEVLIIIDEKSRKIGKALYKVCSEIRAEAMLVEIIERDTHGSEPPKTIAEAMKHATVVIAPTTKSLSHTEARRNATEAGVRMATMPGITEEVMIRTMSSDYTGIADLSTRIAKVLSNGKTARVTSPGGTDITMSINGRTAIPDTGILHEAGSFGNLPAGEAFIAPIEGSSNGKIVIDGAMAGIKELDSPITVIVESGNVKDIQGGKSAEELTQIIESTKDRNAKNLAELGIGTNENAELSGNLLEVEKVLGTVHIAFGDNKSFGGRVKAPIHIDGVILKPTLTVDDRTIISGGKILL
ncbi:MAG: aminopeptidase [Firmicutes bacterium]|nr:aminopeptidase [Bacillota bacterium]